MCVAQFLIEAGEGVVNIEVRYLNANPKCRSTQLVHSPAQKKCIAEDELAAPDCVCESSGVADARVNHRIALRTKDEVDTRHKIALQRGQH